MASHETQALNARAAEWLAAQQRDNFAQAERAELEDWLQADPANAVAYARAQQAWERSRRLQLAPHDAPARSPIERLLPVRRMAAAAFVAFIALGAGLWWVAWRPDVHATGLGERRTVVLEDGSHVELNTTTRIEVDYSSDRRRIHLASGEALFEVVKDGRPFIVEGGGAVVRALGTAFNVRLRDQVVEVTVAEGTVTVGEERAAGEAESPPPARVSAGSAAVVGPGAVARITLEEDIVRRRLAWREGAIELKGETLQQAVEEFNRYRSGKLLVADPRVASIRVGGRFKVDEADKFLSAVQAGFPVRLVAGTDGTVYLLARD
ncbi:MAG: FecR family protein [Steroidobacteraceae bacterium]